MAAAIDPVAPWARPERGSWAKEVGPARPDLEAWPGSRLPGGPSPGAAERQSGGATGELAVGRGASSPAWVGAAPLDLTEWTVGSSVVVSVAGEVDIATAGQLSGALGAALDRRAGGLICDLSGVEFLGAAGLTVLLVARGRAIARRASFALVCPQPRLRRIIALVGLDAVFSLHDDVAAAATAQGRRRGPRPRRPTAREG